MNLNALYNSLCQLSENEKFYQSGGTYSGWKTMPQEIVNGRKVSRLIIDNFTPLHHTSNPSVWNQEHLSFHQNLSIKRNSRFNPVPEHVHSHIELNYVYSGTCPQTINGNNIVLQKNQVLLIDTDCPHSVAELGMDDIMISVLIKKEFLRNHLFSQFSKDSVLSRFFVNAINKKTNHDHFLLFHSENDRRIPLFFQELFCECFDPSINSNDILMHLFYLIMAELINVYENDFSKESEFTDKMPVTPMIRYIEKNYRTCTQESVADFFHISPNYVSILLKKHIGMTYIQLIQKQKLSAAAYFLKNTHLPVTEIANETGYENMSFFYKKFYEKYGCSPKDYRRNKS